MDDKQENNGVEILNAEDYEISRNDTENYYFMDDSNENNKKNNSILYETKHPESSIDWTTIDPNSPRKKYAEIYRSIDEEEMKILQLEERRKKLERDMVTLQQEIEYEKMMFREAIDFEIERKHETSPRNQYSSIKENVINPLKLDKDEIKSRLQEYQKTLENSKSPSHDINFEHDPDIERFKSNLKDYKKSLNSFAFEQITKEKRRASEKVFEKHFQQVEEKCAEQIDYIKNIQKSIEKDFSNDFCAKKI